MPKIVIYYQTFSGLLPLLYPETPLSALTVAAVHFGYNTDGSPYIHLNNDPPDSSKFDELWQELFDAANRHGIEVNLLVGGAGSAFQKLFADFKHFYPLLKTTLQEHPQVTGLNLNVEEIVELSQIQMLIRQLKSDFPNLRLTMAPLQSSLAQDQPGMGGFCYKDLWYSQEGHLIDYFNVQAYYDGGFTKQALDQMVDNGYPANRLVMCMLSNQVDVASAAEQARLMTEAYPDFGGVCDWELYNIQPNPSSWVTSMSHALTSKAAQEPTSWLVWLWSFLM